MAQNQPSVDNDLQKALDDIEKKRYKSPLVLKLQTGFAV
jgi:hypothetical protein